MNYINVPSSATFIDRGQLELMHICRKFKGDGYTKEAAVAVYQEMLNKKQCFLPAQVIRKLVKRIEMTDFQRQDAIAHLQGGLGANDRSRLSELVSDLKKA